MKKETSLVKIDFELYEKIRKKVKENPVTFPSIKNFIETAITRMLRTDLQNFGQIFSKVISYKPEGKNFTLCIVCGRTFLKEKQDKSEKAKICPNCQKMIRHFSGKIK